MTRTEIDAQLDRHRRAFESRDPELLAAGHIESGSFESPAAGHVEGRAKIKGVYEYWLASFPDLELTWQSPVIDGNRVALFWHFRGTVSGKFFGEVKPGTRVEFDGAGDYVMASEGIVSVKHVFDFTGALVNAGVLKVKPV